MKAFCIRRKIYVVYMLVLILLLGVILYGKWYHYSASVLAQNETTPTPYPPVMPLEEWQAVFRPTADCELPCWLGVVPGATTLDQAVDIVLTQFSGIEDPRERDDPSPNTMTFLALV
jgi:hypothetical protein